MPPKTKTSPHVFIVVSPSGVDSVHVSIESAQKRASAVKSEGPANIKLEVHSVVGGRVQIDPEKPADDVVKAKPEVKAVQPASQAAKLKEQVGDASTDAPKADAKPEAQPAAAESKAKDAQQADSEPKSKDVKPKDSKPKESKAKEPKAKETKAKEPKSESKPKESKAKESKPKEPKSESKAKDAKPKEPKSDAKSADSKEDATPSKSAPKTVPADEQRAINAKKGTKAADEDLPANVQALLSSTSDALEGLTVVVTGIPPTIGRKNAEKLVTGHGGKLGKSISGKTDLVVLGNDAGPKKLEQIKDLALETMDEESLIKTLENGRGDGTTTAATAATKKKRAAPADAAGDEDGEEGSATGSGKNKKAKKN